MINEEQQWPDSLNAAELIELSADAISLHDSSGRAVFMNQRAQQLLNCGAQEGTSPESKASALPALQAALAAAREHGHWHGELQRPGRDGKTIYTSARCKRLSCQGNTQVLLVETDRTTEKMLELQFLKAQRLLPLGQLAGGIAHDFNNLLAVMRGHAELVLMRPESVPQNVRDHLADVVTAAERATDLTRQLLTYSRKQLLTPQRLNVNDILKGLGKMLHRALGERTTLDCQYATDLPQVNADPGMLEQVIMNLVLNARTAMPDGGVITICSRLFQPSGPAPSRDPLLPDGPCVEVSVRDTGIGMTPEKLRQVLAGSAQPASGDASGFGLAAVQRIASLHRGVFRLESNVGQGSTARFLLPAISEAPATQAPASDPMGGAESILLVEPDLGVRVVSRKVLEAYGYRVHEATSGTQAMALADTVPFDLVVSEISLPGELTGPELIQAIRVQKPRAKALLTCGHSPEAAANALSALGLQNTPLMQKTGSTKSLVQAVRRALDK